MFYSVMAISHRVDGGIADVTLDFPPVNALPAEGWLGIAELLGRLGRDPAVRVVVLAGAGRGFCAGVDIKEIQREKDRSQQALLRVSRGCFEAFAAVYEC